MSLYDTNFTGWDWGIVVVYLAASIVIGLWANRYVGNLSDYLLAGRTLRQGTHELSRGDVHDVQGLRRRRVQGRSLPGRGV